MDDETTSRAPAAGGPWLPLTAGRVAAFASARNGRLWLVMATTALIVAVTVVRFLAAGWWPVINRAVSQLPAEGEIRSGRLVWPTNAVTTLADNGLLAIVINPTDLLKAGQSADLQLEFRATELDVESLFGYVPVPYPSGWIISLNHTDLEPLWGAWRPHLLVATGALVVPGLLCFWSLLAGPLALFVAAYARLLGRQSSRAGAWRLCMAAMAPGALVFALAMLGYTARQINLAEWLLANGLQPFLLLALVLFAPLWLPVQEPPSPFAPPATPPDEPKAAAAKNPFATPVEAPAASRRARPKNPFPSPGKSPPRKDPPDDAPLNPS